MIRILLSCIILSLMVIISMTLGYAGDTLVSISGESSPIISGEQKSSKKIRGPSQRVIPAKPSLGSPWIRPSYVLGEFSRDDSIYRFVSRDISLTDTSYRPPMLVSLSGAYINQAGRRSSIRIEAKPALDRLALGFYQEFKTPLVVISGYRSAAYQQQLWDLGRCSDTHCAPPGNSEHQLGLAIDVFDATTAADFVNNPRYKRYVAWFQSNAHLYGWHQSYQKGEAVDGYMVEPWHWRYLGVDMATRLHHLGWTYTEYVEFQNRLVQYW